MIPTIINKYFLRSVFFIQFATRWPCSTTQPSVSSGNEVIICDVKCCKMVNRTDGYNQPGKFKSIFRPIVKLKLAMLSRVVTIAE